MARKGGVDRGLMNCPAASYGVVHRLAIARGQHFNRIVGTFLLSTR